MKTVEGKQIPKKSFLYRHSGNLLAGIQGMSVGAYCNTPLPERCGNDGVGVRGFFHRPLISDPRKSLVQLALFIACLSVVSLIGCARTLPYEREYLADPIMQFDPDPEENTMRQHLLNTREGSIGGYGGGGGGCGCN